MIRRILSFLGLILIEALCTLLGIYINSPALMMIGAFGLGMSTAFIIAISDEMARTSRR